MGEDCGEDFGGLLEVEGCVLVLLACWSRQIWDFELFWYHYETDGHGHNKEKTKLQHVQQCPIIHRWHETSI